MAGTPEALSWFAGAIRRQKRVAPAHRCGSCRHFRNDAVYLEATIPGLSSFCSGSSSVRGDDGLCLRHDRYLGAGRSCPQFEPIPQTKRNFPIASTEAKSS